MRKLIITTLKSLAQLFQIPSESSGGCYVALDVNVKVYRLILKNCLYSTESDSGCSNQTNLRRNTPLRKRPTGLESACAPADIVPLNNVGQVVRLKGFQSNGQQIETWAGFMKPS